MKLSTDKYGVNVKITPINETKVEIQFGHYEPASQVASAKDMRELASIFLEVAELLEPLGEKKREVCVVLDKVASNYTLQGVFSGLTYEETNALQRAIRELNAVLPQGCRIYTLD